MQPLPPLIRWNRSAAFLLSGFFLTIGLIVYVWWPLAEELLRTIDWHGRWWLYMDWLLIGLFLFMSLTIIARADLRRDGLILLVATIGGLVIEAWGTQTNLWFYYTSERPPLWIVPAWPIATLSIDRITRLLSWLLNGPAHVVASERSERSNLLAGPAHVVASARSEQSNLLAAPAHVVASERSERSNLLAGPAHVVASERSERSNLLPAPSSPASNSALRRELQGWQIGYWIVFIAFLAIMIAFVMPTFNKTATILAFLLCVVLIATPPDHRQSVLVFTAGAALGYFLELWGTTRECWTYYTYQTPPLFAVLAHGMAAVSFWHAGLWLTALAHHARGYYPTPNPSQSP